MMLNVIGALKKLNTSSHFTKFSALCFLSAYAVNKDASVSVCIDNR